MKRSKKKNKNKFTDEELSRALSHAHELKNGGEDRVGMRSDEVGCLVQCAKNIGDCAEVFDIGGDWSIIWAFDDFFVDNGYSVTPEELLRFLEKEGVA